MFDLHMHTSYCDGKSSAEDMIKAAIEAGLDTVGISGHSYTAFDESYCMSIEGTARYIAEINELKKKYAGRIRVLLGTELDYFARIDLSPYDYYIGSCHYIFAGGEYIDVDYSAERLIEGADRHFGGDVIEVAARYYEQVGGIVSKTGCDIIGHFDLVTKFNESYEGKGGRPLIDTEDPRYIRAWKSAVDRIFEDTRAIRSGDKAKPCRLETLGLIEAGDRPVFEINTGAIAKGYRSSPYPAEDQIEYISSKGGILILDSDSHSAETVAFGFGKYMQLCYNGAKDAD